MNILGTLAFATGALLIYSAVKDTTPQKVFKSLAASKGTSTGVGASAGANANLSGRIVPGTPLTPPSVRHTS